MRPDAFRRLTRLALANLFAVITLGAVVRVTGAGMGCPDWPKCFGQYVPPTNVSQLPPDYKTRFAVLGREIADFNAFKTWTEYANRLAGATLGVVVLAQCIASFGFWRRDRTFALLCVLMLALTVFVGWLGSTMVSSDLEPIKVTSHMVVAVPVVALGVMIARRASALEAISPALEAPTAPFAAAAQISAATRGLLYAALAMTIFQLFWGTQVREEMDAMAKALEGRGREFWVERLSWIFKAHRSISLVVLAINAALLYRIFQETRGAGSAAFVLAARRYALWVGAFVTASALTGAVMAYLAVPRAAQALHIILPHATFAAQFALLLALRQSSKANGAYDYGDKRSAFAENAAQNAL